MGLSIDFQRGLDERSARVHLVGDLDAEGGQKAKRALAAIFEAGRIEITVNLDRVGFLDSSGLASLIASLRTAREHGGDVRIETSNNRIRRVLEVTALAQVFKLQPAPSAAA
jgi:anti-sigma B factor antagonist